MDNQAISAMQTRLERLEGRNRLLTYTFVAWLGISALLLVLSAAAPSSVQDVVRAKAFEVVDASGQPRARLVTLPDGSPWLSLYDASGEERAALGTLPDGSPGLALCDASGQSRAVLTTGPDGSAWLWLYDASGRVLFSAP